jgi:hypothetical protein
MFGTPQCCSETKETNSALFPPPFHMSITKCPGYFFSSNASPCHGLPRDSLSGKSSEVKYFRTLLWCHRLPYFSNIYNKSKIVRNDQKDTTNARKYDFSGILMTAFWIKWKFEILLHISNPTQNCPARKIEDSSARNSTWTCSNMKTTLILFTNWTPSEYIQNQRTQLATTRF